MPGGAATGGFMTVLDAVERHVHLTPAAPAVIEDHRQLDYHTLWQQSGHAATGLQAAGYRPGDRIAVLMSRSIEWIVAVLAVMRAGCVYVPLSAANPVDRNRAVVKQARAVAVLGPGLQDLWDPAEHTGRPVALETLAAQPTDASPLSSPPRMSRSAHDEAYCIFTSGSTGTPKGIRMPHGAFAHFVRACPEVFATGSIPHPRHLQFCEPSFDVHIFEVFHPLSLGGAIVIDPRTDFISFDHYVDRIERQQVDVVSPPTAFWHLWRSRIDEGRSRWPRGLKRIVVGGEMAQPARFSLQGLPAGLLLMNGYGPAETNYATVHRVAPGDAGLGALPVGRPLPHFSIHLLDDTGQPTPKGGVGEICIAGAGVALGYVNGTSADEARFSTIEVAGDSSKSERLYKTGDLGLLDASGALVCLGRLDDQVKVQGVRVEVADVEAHVLRHPEVKATAVWAVDDDTGGKVLAMALELAASPDRQAASAADLAKQLQSALPAYMVPRLWTAVDRWPLTSNGKIDRQRLRTLALQPVTLPPLAAPQAATLEHAALIAELTTLWRQVRRRNDPVSASTPLTEIEPSSLRIGMFYAEIFDRFQLDVAPETFFGLATLQDIARRLSSLQEASGRPLELNRDPA